MNTVKDPSVEKLADKIEQAELHLQVLPKNPAELDEPTVMEALTRLSAVKRLLDNMETDADALRRRRRTVATKAEWDVRYANGTLDPAEETKAQTAALDKAEAALVRVEATEVYIRLVAATYRAIRAAFELRRDELYNARREERMVPIDRFAANVSAAYLAGELGDSIGTIVPDGIELDFQPSSYGLEIRDVNRDRVSISWPRDDSWGPTVADVSWSSGSSRNGIEAARHYAHLIRLAALLAEMATSAKLVAP